MPNRADELQSLRETIEADVLAGTSHTFTAWLVDTPTGDRRSGVLTLDLAVSMAWNAEVSELAPTSSITFPVHEDGLSYVASGIAGSIDGVELPVTLIDDLPVEAGDTQTVSGVHWVLE